MRADITDSFSSRLLRWYDREGRKDLPWQIKSTPYRVWVSEIMLQQTRVQTVIPYFERFVKQFPDVTQLADAGRDAVLQQWAGLGYYARARNLHRAAVRMCEQFNGQVPQRYEELITLPGIGRSTAGAILALCFEQALPILDGNVKRVLARHRDIAGVPSNAATAKKLWALSQSLLPSRGIADYTQAIMDLGATICTRRNPHCADCPLSQDCKALIHDRVEQRPATRPRRAKATRSTVMLLVTHNDSVLLIKRPANGVWGGLLSLPEVKHVGEATPWCLRKFGIREQAVRWDKLTHEFTHFKLRIQPVAIECRNMPRQVMEREDFVWCKIRDADRAAIPAPVKKLLLRRATQAR